MVVGMAQSGGVDCEPADLNGVWEVVPGTESDSMPPYLENTLTISKAADGGFFVDIVGTYAGGCCGPKKDSQLGIPARSQAQAGAYEGRNGAGSFIFVTVSYDLIRFTTDRNFRNAEGWSCEYQKSL